MFRCKRKNQKSVSQKSLQPLKRSYDKQQIIDDLTEFCTDYALRKQLADDEGIPFEEVLSETLGTYVERLPPHERDFARSLEERKSPSHQ